MRTVQISQREIDELHAHAERMLDLLHNLAGEDDRDSLEEFAAFVERVLGPFPEQMSAP